MNPAVVSKIVKVAGALLALYGVEVSPEQSQLIAQVVLVGYAILSALEAKVKVNDRGTEGAGKDA